ncbi:MAG TPA: hypothetical protein VLN49_21620 [Gemmatimonadaceae bacterium]|nr:hypothetical protein [Gemmatimonadaceae bacterium]
MVSPGRQERANCIDEALFRERLHEERVGPSFSGARFGGENAEHQHDGMTKIGVGFQSSAEGKTVHFGDEHFGNHDVRPQIAGALERAEAIGRELDRKAGLVEEIGLELADARIAFDDENHGAPAARRA